MLLGEALIEAGVITDEQLKKAVLAQKRFPNHSLGRIVVKLFNVPVEIVETTFIKMVILPILEQWFRRELAFKPGPNGLNLADMLSVIEIDLTSFARYEGERVSFLRNDEGYYLEEKRHAKIESLSLEVKTFYLRTIRRQEITLHDAGFEVILGDSKHQVKPENPGFVAEARLKLMQALKQK